MEWGNKEGMIVFRDLNGVREVMWMGVGEENEIWFEMLGFDMCMVIWI